MDVYNDARLHSCKLRDTTEIRNTQGDQFQEKVIFGGGYEWFD